MREILFRAKRIDNGEWVEGFYVKCRKYDYILPIFNEFEQFHGYDDRYDEWVEIDPETLCQYTGKTDETRKKIYEKDIVGFTDLTSTESGYSEHSCVGEVVWDKEECCFHVTNRLSSESWEVLDECKVVGNVFDNKELLDEL